jgi:hypothetical protein
MIQLEPCSWQLLHSRNLKGVHGKNTKFRSYAKIYRKGTATMLVFLEMDAKALLDELMGKERNVPLSERSQRRMRYDDPSVCKYDMAGLCPHGLFKNTRSDLGTFWKAL